MLKWFEYLWQNKQILISDKQVLGVLPTKLQAEIAMHVHFETLRKVRIFQVFFYFKIQKKIFLGL